jgi:hypothetical protein
MKTTRPNAKDSRKTRKAPTKSHGDKSSGVVPKQPPGERGDGDAIGRIVQLDDDHEPARPVQLGGVTESTPDQEGARSETGHAREDDAQTESR